MDHTPAVEIETYVTTADCSDRVQCPSGHRVNVMPGGRVVQGKRIPDAVRAALVELGMPAAEDAVWIPDGLEV